MISVSNLAKSFGSQTLFVNASFQMVPGQRYGLVGANGSGKSTLMRILAGEEPPSDGSVSIPKRLQLGVLRQDHFRYENDRILDVVMMGYEKFWAVMQERDRIYSLPEMSDEEGILVANLEETIL